MSEVSGIEAVRAEMERFRRALPDLLKTDHAGKWVLFKDGKVQGQFDDRRAAYLEGIQRFGHKGGQVVAKVEAEEGPRYITAAAAFFQ